MTRPSIFIGSSSESLLVVQRLTERLSRNAVVRPWSDATFFRPGLYYLDNLIHELPEFDFAVFVFGPDDTVESRGKRQASPRDNVIFEFGYAMAKLGRERVFHLVPKGDGLNVKILSDLAGMKPWEFQMPPGLLKGRKTPSRATVKQLDAALEGPSRYIAEIVTRLGPRKRLDRGVAEGPQYVSDVYAEIRAALSPHGRNTVRNLALDMEQTWPSVRDRFVFDRECPRLHWCSLMIDPQSTLIQSMDGPAFSAAMAAAMIDNMHLTLPALADRPKGRGPTYEARAYGSAPSVHGFLVNDSVAFMSLCGPSQQWTTRAGSPYLRFQRGSRVAAADHMIDSFRALFDYQWDRGRPLWPLAPGPAS